jgi:hypothetical protein
MKNSFIKSITMISAMILLTGTVMAGSMDDGGKTKKSQSNQNMAPNGNYKHNMPSSPGNKFKDSFTKPEKETINRNYKQQNQEKRNVKFKDNFTKPQKTKGSYKHPHGL